MTQPSSNTLADQVADRIRHQILSDGLAENDPFMTEAQVSQRYAVSRNVTREAVGRLRGMGILQSRQGKGLLVARPDPVALMARTLPFITEPDDVRQLAAFRFVIEVGAVELAAVNATVDMLDQLVELANQFETLAKLGGFGLEEDRIELAFHSLILEMTANPVISGMHQVLIDYFHARRDQADNPEGAPRSAQDHHTIAQALRRRDAESTRKHLSDHLRHLIEPSQE
jgi:GntR family transcriptional repressor for pyruvate dehydrogenase complex